MATLARIHSDFSAGGWSMCGHAIAEVGSVNLRRDSPGNVPKQLQESGRAFAIRQTNGDIRRANRLVFLRSTRGHRGSGFKVLWDARREGVTYRREAVPSIHRLEGPPGRRDPESAELLRG
jgi:hypothetical protein